MDRIHRVICRSADASMALDRMLAARRWTADRAPEEFIRRMTVGAGVVDGAYVLEWDADDELITARLGPIVPVLASEIGRCAFLEEGRYGGAYEEFDRSGRTLVWDQMGSHASVVPAPSEQAWLDPEREDLPDALVFGRLGIDRDMRSENDGSAERWTSDDRTWCHDVIDTGNADFFDDALDQSYDEPVDLPGLGQLVFRDRTIFKPSYPLMADLQEDQMTPTGNPIIDPVLEALKGGLDVRLGNYMIVGVERFAPYKGTNPRTGEVIEMPGKCRVVMEVNEDVDD